MNFTQDGVGFLPKVATFSKGESVDSIPLALSAHQP